MRCSLLNYDGSSKALLSQYVRRAGCQESTLATGSTGSMSSADALTDCDLIFLHLTSPDETVREELANQLKNHTGVVITSPFPKQQFSDLFTEPFAFLAEPFSFAQFNKCIATYQYTIHNG